jgi:hypothetical protein
MNTSKDKMENNMSTGQQELRNNKSAFRSSQAKFEEKLWTS